MFGKKKFFAWFCPQISYGPFWTSIQFSPLKRAQPTGEGKSYHVFPASLPTAAHATSGDGITHLEESAIRRPPYARALKRPWVASITVIDKREHAIPPSLKSQPSFALLSSNPVEHPHLSKISSKCKTFQTSARTHHRNNDKFGSQDLSKMLRFLRLPVEVMWNISY